jgi:hypothetical protein
LNDELDAFISYQSADEGFARRLASDIESCLLNERKLRVFFAPWDIQPGSNFIEKLNEGLRNARYFLLILSPEYLKAEWPTAERDAAIYADPSGRLGRVIPILKSSCTIPPLLRFRNYIDFRSNVRYKAELIRLISMLANQPLPRDCSSLSLYKASQNIPSKILVENLGESWKPDPVNEEIRCNLFRVEKMPTKIWSAPYILPGAPSMHLTRGQESPPHIVKEKRVFTFVNLSTEDHVFRGITENYDVSSVDIQEWMNDENYQRWLIELLNWGILKHCKKFKLSFDEIGRFNKKRFYYNKDVIMKQVKWPVSDRKSPKDLLIEYTNFTAHRSVELRFEILGTNLLLKINTSWLFSRDGYDLIKGRRASTLTTNFLAKQKNTQNFNEIRFWAWFLSDDGKKIKMNFGDQFIEIEVHPLATKIDGGVFGDYKPFAPMICSPPEIYQEEQEGHD